jgi:hypothetical protein
MVSWIYQDPPNWYIIAREHRDESQYSNITLNLKRKANSGKEKKVYTKNSDAETAFITLEGIIILQHMNNKNI